MLKVKSENYDSFRCVAGACTLSCCRGGWQIMIDEDSLKRYEQTGNDELDKRLADGIDREEEYFRTDEYGCCSMLNENGLCSIQLALGEEGLCETCSRYPRHIEEFENVREYSLSLSCPEAARIILERREPLTFTETETDEEEDQEEYEDFDYLLYSALTDARRIIFGIIQDRELGFTEKAERMAEFAAALQVCLDMDHASDMDRVIYGPQEEQGEKIYYEKGMSRSEFQKRFEGIPEMGYGLRPGEMLGRNAFSKLFEMEMLKSDWADVLDTAWKAWDTEPELTEEREIQAEQLMMFWIYTYFCGAVYDGWIYSKVLLAICSTWWIMRINAANRMEGGIAEAACRYAREIEHSDENLNALEEYFMF